MSEVPVKGCRIIIVFDQKYILVTITSEHDWCTWQTPNGSGDKSRCHAIATYSASSSIKHSLASTIRLGVKQRYRVAADDSSVSHSVRYAGIAEIDHTLSASHVVLACIHIACHGCNICTALPHQLHQPISRESTRKKKETETRRKLGLASLTLCWRHTLYE